MSRGTHDTKPEIYPSGDAETGTHRAAPSPRRNRGELASQPTMMGIRVSNEPPEISDSDAPGAAGPRPRRDSITITRDARTYLELQAVDPSLVAGARNLLVGGLAVRPGEKLVLICEASSQAIATAILNEASAEGLEIQPYLVGPEQATNDAFIRRILSVLQDAELSIAVTSQVSALPDAFLEKLVASADGGRRHAHLVGVTEAMIRQSMRGDFQEMAHLGRRLVSKLQGQGTIKIAAGPKTLLEVEFDESHRWHLNDGMQHQPGWTRVPGGELYTTPVNVSGTLIPDGGIWLPTGQEIELPRRVSLRFLDGKLTGATGPGADRLMDALGADENATRVGRFVFGINISLLTAIGAQAQDLTMPGIYLVLGDPAAERTGAAWSSGVSIPVAVRRPDVSVNGQPVMVRGRYARDLL